MRFQNFTSKHFPTKATIISKKLSLFSFTGLLAIDFDISILFIVFLLIGVVTFLAGTAYGIYLNNKISEKDASNQLSRS
jgi:uncharacterized membrane protein